MRLDRDRARIAIVQNVASPLGVTLEEAIESIIKAWTSAIADGIRDSSYFAPDAVLAAFGGAGPMLACKIAEELSLDRVLIPGTAAVFSALGIGFSDLSQQYRAPVADAAPDTVSAARERLIQEAARDMFAEGFDLAECVVESFLLASPEAEEEPTWLALGEDGAAAGDVPPDAELFVVVTAAKSIPKIQLAQQTDAADAPASSDGEREVLGERTKSIPVYRLEQQVPGSRAEGPLVLEEDYFTALVPQGWHLSVTDNRDIWLLRG